MNTTTNTARIESAARALLDGKISAVHDLAETRETLTELRAKIESAERADTAAYTAAQRAGWTPDDLKKLGLDTPHRKAPGRPRRTRQVSPRENTNSTAEEGTAPSDTRPAADL